MKQREPILMCATGMKGVGKTYTTKQSIESYVRGDSRNGVKPRKVLIYDVNYEYTDYRVLDVKDVKKFTRQGKIEVRRVLPITHEGKKADLSEMADIMNLIIKHYRGGLLILEDINKYLIQARTSSVIGLLTTNRHRDLDIICHYQSLSALDPRMWQNTSFIRVHKQMDDIDRYRNRIPNYELFKVAQCLVNYKYLKMGEKRFFCFVANEENYIAGNFTNQEYKIACKEYLELNQKMISIRMKRLGSKGMEAREKAINQLCNELFQKYYRGI